MRVKCLVQEHNTMTWPALEPGTFDPARVQRANHFPRLPGSLHTCERVNSLCHRLYGRHMSFCKSQSTRSLLISCIAVQPKAAALCKGELKESLQCEPLRL